jgi:hypothetical protein
MQKEGGNYLEVGSMQLLPVDLWMLWTHLVSMPSVTDLQIWVTIIVATLLLLPQDEFYTIAGAEFQSAMFSIPDATKIVESLVLQVVCGKVDKKWVMLRLYANHEYPELCPVQPLLIYLYAINWKRGYVFPWPQELNNPPSDGVYTTKHFHSTLNKQVQDLCRKVLLPCSNMKVGCQTWRKTG